MVKIILSVFILIIFSTSILANSAYAEMEHRQKITNDYVKVTKKSEATSQDAKLESKFSKEKASEIKTKNAKKNKEITIWKPKPGTTWNWQLDGEKVSPFYSVEMYDIDLFDNSKTVVDSLHKKGIKVICYISVGSWENWRPDARKFSTLTLGKNYDNWEGEKWLDIRKIDLIGPIIKSRLDLCKSKGFDGVEPDNIDGYANDSGFTLTYKDQLNFNIWLSAEAHKRGLSIGLKNDEEQVKDLLPYFDWALTEDCFVDKWCDMVEPFVKSGKAVFQAEYTDNNVTLEQFCLEAKKMMFSAILKNRDLDGWQKSCTSLT